MSEQNNAEVFAKIEDEIKNGLSGDVQKNALDFTAFLRANDLLPEWHDSGHGWSVVYKNESIGFILINGEEQMPGPWRFGSIPVILTTIRRTMI